LIGKLIVLGIIILALVVFVPSISKIFNPSNIKALEQRIDNATFENNSTIASPSLNHTIPVSLSQLDPKYIDKQTYTGQVFAKTGNTCQISVPDMAQTINGQQELTHIIEMEQCALSVGQPVQITLLTAKSNTLQPVSPTNAIQIVPYATSGPSYPNVNAGEPGNSASATQYPTLPPYYQTINLNAQNKGNDVLLSYEDTSGKTTSVTVTLRNTDGQIFTGTFSTSQFQTEIKDVPNTPHIIDMSVANSYYGSLHGSVYVPSNIQNSTINGILAGP